MVGFFVCVWIDSYNLIPIFLVCVIIIAFSVFSRNRIFTYIDANLKPAQLKEQTSSWNICGCPGERYVCIFCQKLFSSLFKDKFQTAYIHFLY